MCLYCYGSGFLSVSWHHAIMRQTCPHDGAALALPFLLRYARHQVMPVGELRIGGEDVRRA